MIVIHTRYEDCHLLQPFHVMLWMPAISDDDDDDDNMIVILMMMMMMMTIMMIMMIPYVLTLNYH